MNQSVLTKEVYVMTALKKDNLNKTLAVAGTILACLPIFLTLLMGIVRTLQIGRLRIDYLMPAELGLLVYVGAALLIWAAVRAKVRLKILIGSVVCSIIFIVGGQVYAIISGLASGETEASGLPFVIVISTIILYIIAIVVIDVTGILLIRDVYSKD